ncbi:MAG: NAD(P)H-binding protein [Gammaproteobacteria bacterium]|nr:NAD(P)H-binding protein [Gammaproteobacteria bacterium]
MRTDLWLRTLLLLATLLLYLSDAGAENPEARLNILVYGATGNIGTLVVAEALDRGHHVSAVSRDPSRITRQHENLSAVKGDLLDTDSIRSLATGQDVVIISVRGIIGDSKTPESTLQRIAVEKVVDTLRAMGEDAPRLIHVGGAGTLVVKPGVLYADKLPKIFLPKDLELEVQGQILALEYLRAVDDVNWTYATPPTSFTKGKRTGVYRTGGDRILKDKRGKSRISRADFAVALIDEAESAAHNMQRFTVAY